MVNNTQCKKELITVDTVLICRTVIIPLQFTSHAMLVALEWRKSASDRQINRQEDTTEIYI